MSRLSGPTTPGVRPWVWLSTVLAVIALACLAVAVQPTGPGDARGSLARFPAGAAAGPDSGDPTPSRVARPVEVRIPSIDVSAPVIGLGLKADRTVQVPGDPSESGWYRPGPRPGEPGSAVILGHVDSTEGPAVFYRLRQLRPEDEVVVAAADGSTTTFEVVRLAIYANADFPAEKVYAGSGHLRTLNLVTCSGVYDAATGYQANLVVYTRWVHSTR